MKNKLSLLTLLFIGLFVSGCSKTEVTPTPEGKYTLTYLAELTSDVKNCFEVTKVEYTTLAGTVTELPPIEFNDSGLIERRVYSIPNGTTGKIRIQYGVNKDATFPNNGTISVALFMLWGPKSEVYSQYATTIPFTGDVLRQIIRDGQNFFEIETTLR